jgi:putative ABC transport system permease protein
MAIIAIALGLIRGESARDLRTLTATGASPRRAGATASTAAALAVLGVLLGTGAAYLALLAVFHSDLSQLLPVPLGQLVPLVVRAADRATAVGWLLAGREPRGIARQALWMSTRATAWPASWRRRAVTSPACVCWWSRTTPP